MTGIKLKNNEPSRFSNPDWINVDNHYLYYDPEISGSVDWLQLKIHNKPNENNEVKPNMNICFLCRQISNEKMLSCEHFIHGDCFGKLPDGFKRCLICSL